MSTLHHNETRAAIKKRLQELRPDATRKWGSMTVDQMLWHVNQPLKESLGEYIAPEGKPPLPPMLLRWLVLNVPWPRGAATRPDLVAVQRYDFEKERAECLSLIDRFAQCDVGISWPKSGNFGSMTGQHWSRLHAKHLDHHLRQFGV